MTDAYVIQSAGETAGIVVLEKRGVRFYASAPSFNRLEGKTFRSVDAARRAVDELKRGNPPAFRRAA